MYNVPLINLWLSIASVGVEVATVVLIAIVLLQKKFPDLRDISAFVEKWGLWIAFFAAIGGTAMTLFYSEVLNFAPCGLCWMQRMFLYPQVIILGIGAWKKDSSVALYGIWLSAIGAVLALYNHYLQMGGLDLIPCPVTRVNAAGITADCAQRFLFEFGYMTFPLMSFSLFAFLIVVMVIVKKSAKSA